MFYGETAITLDSKGRMAIPTRYRDAIAELCANQLVFTYSAFDAGCLWLYPQPEWERVRDQVMGLSTFNEAHRAMQRRLVGCASLCEPDSAGRLLIPQSLREVTGLDKRAVLMGMGQRFELWNENILAKKRVEEDARLLQQASTEMESLVL